MQITGGSVTFSRTVQPAQYESKKAEVTLTFTLDEGATLDTAQTFLAEVSNVAKTRALNDIGLKVAATASVEPTAAPVGLKGNVVDEDRPKSTRGPKSKAEKEAAKVAEIAKINQADPLDLEPQRDTVAEAANEAQEAAGSDADADLLESSPPPQPVTDKDMMDAVSKKMTDTGNSKAIKDIRSKYVQPPLGIKDIPQNKRPAFLEDLKKVVKV